MFLLQVGLRLHFHLPHAHGGVAPVAKRRTTRSGMLLRGERRRGNTAYNLFASLQFGSQSSPTLNVSDPVRPIEISSRNDQKSLRKYYFGNRIVSWRTFREDCEGKLPAPPARSLPQGTRGLHGVSQGEKLEGRRLPDVRNCHLGLTRPLKHLV